MCGIIGYIGKREAHQCLFTGLEQLEYRGYDSAGICTSHNDTLQLHKVEGRVIGLKEHVLPGKRGIAHTRWATHGRVCNHNAHPFMDSSKQFTLVHNGIIENYLELKEQLRKQGVQFSSDTDSEVIVHLIAHEYTGNLQEAVQRAIQKLQGAFAFCVMKNDTEEVVGARNGSPLVIGVGEGENFLASDVSAIVAHTKKVIYLNDFELAHITHNSIRVLGFDGKEKEPEVKQVSWDVEQAQKQGYKHFMLKEIMEQPQVAEDSLHTTFQIPKPTRIRIVACGTASYAGLVGKYLIEKIAKIPVSNDVASEFRYNEVLLANNELVIAISQSGETADTLAAIRVAKQHNAPTLGLINVQDSTIAREVDHVVYTRAGPEIGVASTKAFTSQLITLYKLAYHLAGEEFPHPDIPEKIRQTLHLNEEIKNLAKKYYHSRNMLYIGRKLNFPLALEGALKLKEISYCHAEAYPAGELKHGPIALVSDDMPTVAVCPQDDVYVKTFSNIEEIKARGGKIISIATAGDEKIQQISDDVIYVPHVPDELYPLVMAIPLQLWAYHIADLKECDIDKPRNLAKSVTVE
jgi:glutamine---fructose-6-phosphate transaminase (isomerizing)